MTELVLISTPALSHICQQDDCTAPATVNVHSEYFKTSYNVCTRHAFPLIESVFESLNISTDQYEIPF